MFSRGTLALGSCWLTVTNTPFFRSPVGCEGQIGQWVTSCRQCFEFLSLLSVVRGRPWGIFFGFYKTRHILLSNSANCTVLRAVVLTQYRRVTDGQTDRQTELL